MPVELRTIHVKAHTVKARTVHVKEHTVKAYSYERAFTVKDPSALRRSVPAPRSTMTRLKKLVGGCSPVRFKRFLS